jgi:cytochrome c peroxidase
VIKMLLRLGLVVWLATTAAAADFDWKLPAGFPKPAVPNANPMSVAKVELGRHLFYDKRLSREEKQSCSTCHRQELAFTDGRARAIGATGQAHPRSSMSLVNVAYVPLLTWANPSLQTLETQIAVPLFGEHPVEQGMKGDEARFLALVSGDSTYRALFRQAYPAESDPYSMDNVIKAIAAFVRTIISARSPYDRYRSGADEGAMSEAARSGERLFFSNRTACSQCHGNFTFGGEVRFEGGQEPHVWYFNTGVSNVYEPPEANGVHQHTGSDGDVGRFRPPTLRNVGLTAPYMHDGSIATLEGVIDHYAAGGRVQGVRNKSPRVRGFALSGEEKQDLIAFLHSLTDGELVRDPRWSNPWTPVR